MHIQNLNPFDMNVLDNVYKKNEPPLTLTSTQQQIGSLNNIPVSRVLYNGPSFMPPQKEGTVYITNMLVCQWFKNNFPERSDMVGPSSSRMTYAADGRPKCIAALVRYPTGIDTDRNTQIGDMQDVEFVNLTGISQTIAKGHPTDFKESFENSPDIQVLTTIEPAPTKATLQLSETEEGDINGIPLYSIEYGNIENLPAPSENKIYIVTMLVAQYVAKHFPERTDVVCPDYGRDNCFQNKGRIEGTTGFLMY